MATTTGRTAVRWVGTAALVVLVLCVVPFGAFLAVEIGGGANTGGRPLLAYFVWVIVVPAVVVALRQPSNVVTAVKEWALGSLAAHAILVVVAVVVLAL